MSRTYDLRCVSCGRGFGVTPIHVCPECLGPLEVIYDYDSLRNRLSRHSIESGPLNIWRYRDLLPISDDTEVINPNVGWSPLILARNLGEYLGLSKLYIKNDTVNPTASFKDRPVAVATTVARDFGFTTLACSSTGNLSAALAAHAAIARLRACVFIPHDLESSKIVGTAVFRPTLFAVRGTYDDVNRLCSRIIDEFNWAFVNMNLRPYYAEGSKTLAFEVAEQLGWQSPDLVVVPAASGSMFIKIWKGFNELQRIGLVDTSPPKMILAQPEGCAPIVHAYVAGRKTIVPERPATSVKSLAIGDPADGPRALNVVRESSGEAIAVTDEEVAQGVALLAQTEGIFAESAGGVSVAALQRLAKEGLFRGHETIVIYITGHGLKTPDIVATQLASPVQIDASWDSFSVAMSSVASYTSISRP